MATMSENESQLAKAIPKPMKDISCQALIVMTPVSRYGFLRKMADSRGVRLIDSVLSLKWKSKFVILRSGCVYIYSNESSSSYDRAFTLFGFQDVQLCSSDIHKAQKWMFKVVDALGDQDRDRSLYFSANSESDMKDWIKAFGQEINEANVMLFSRSSVAEKMENPEAPEKRKYRISDAVRTKIKSTIEIATNTDIHNDSSSEGEDYTVIGEDENDNKQIKEPASRTKPLPLPPLPIKQPTIFKDDVPSSDPPKPLPKPKTTKMMSTDVRPVSVKPTSAVKPMPNVPGKPAITVPKPLAAENSSTATLKERKVPQPPSVLKSSQQRPRIEDVSDYEQGSEYVDTDYELWASDKDFMKDPIIKASYWSQDADKAQQVMLSIAEEGVFLIRDASDGHEYKTLMVCVSDVKTKVAKYKIIKENSSLNLCPGKTGFKSLLEMVQFYQNNPLANRNVKLTKPYSECLKQN